MILLNVASVVFGLAGIPAAFEGDGKTIPVASQPPVPRPKPAAPPTPAPPTPATSYVSDLVNQARKLLAKSDGDAGLAVRMLEQAAGIGDADAMLLLGEVYQSGSAAPRDPARAERLLRSALAAGRIKDASFDLGNLYGDPGPGQDLPKAISAYRAAIDLGHVEAEVRLARLVMSGAGGPPDLGEARRLLESAIAGGAVASGAETLGDLYLMPGAARDPSAAADAYGQSADAGNVDAMVKLGAMLAAGNGVGINVRRAEQLLKKATAAGGGAAAWTSLGDLYRVDSDLKSYAKALAAYRNGVSLGDPDAMIKLAWVLSNGDEESRDLPQARKFLEAAVAGGRSRSAGLALGDLLRADNAIRDLAGAAAAYASASAAGNSRAMIRLAAMYAAGEGVEVDRAKAASLLNDAIAAGEGADAYDMLGDVYRKSSAPEDGPKAVAAYENAVARGSRPATVKLALLLAAGQGVSADPARGRKMLEDAVAGGASGETWRGLGDVFRLPGTGFTDAERALEAYGKAAELGDTAAMFEIGTMLSDGKSVPPDYEAAITMLEGAIAGGDVARSAEALGRLYLTYPGDGGDPAEARKYLEMAAGAGSGSAHLEAATLAQSGYRNATERRAMVDHFRAASRIFSPQRVASEMMRLAAPALIAAAQQLLVDSGETLTVDGKFGQPTSAAIDEFCKAKGIRTCEKAFVSIELLEALVSDVR